MDHFEAPPWARADADSIQVPYKCQCDYDGGDFFTYPARQGWTEEELLGLQELNLSRPGRNPGHVEAFLQTWLYFGTLQCIFDLVGISVTAADFTRIVEGGQTIVTTPALSKLIQKWEKFDDHGLRLNEYEFKHGSLRNLHLSPWEKYRRIEAVHELGEIITSILVKLYELSNRYCRDQAQDSSPPSTAVSQLVLSPEVSISILALGWTLTGVVQKIYRPEVPDARLPLK
jgi:hypothetical protein